MYQLFLYIALFIGIIPFWVLIYKNREFSFKQPIVPFIWLTFIASLYESVGTLLLQLETSYWFRFYPLVEFSALYYFFYRLIKPKNKTLYGVFLVLFVLVYGYSIFYWKKYDDTLFPDAITTTFLTLFVFFGAIQWVKNLFEKMHISNLWKNDGFYFISGFTIYYSSTFLFFLLSDLIFSSNLYYYDYSYVNVLATLILRVLLIIGVWNMNRN